MLNTMLRELQNPEFWTSFAFLLIVGLFIPSMIRYLKKWGKRQALLVEKKLSEAEKVKKEAADLLEKYHLIYQSKDQKYRQLMDEATKEISFLEQESEQKTADRILHKKQETELRLKMIEENGKQDVKNKMLTRIVQLTRQKMTDLQGKEGQPENMEQTLHRFFDALDENEVLLKKEG